VTRKRVIVSGLVQAVGFRYSLAGRAESLDVAGWVRNRPDGSVEAVLEGPVDEVESLVGWCRHGPRGNQRFHDLCVGRAAAGNWEAVYVVSDILEDKGREVLQIEADATVFEAVERMVEANVGSLLVSDGGQHVGIITERDYLRRVALGRRDDEATPVRDVMSSPLVVVTPQTSIDECMAVMTDRRIRHVPVVDGGAVVGIVSIGDVVKFTSRQQSFELKYLTDFISGH
jgi:CBS domain-containing protein